MLLPPAILHCATALATGDAPPARLPGRSEWALFLDLDGTLCHYRSDPADVALDARQHELLRALALRLEGALCVLSGRAEDDLQRVLADLPVHRVGSHGAAADTRDAALRAVLDEAEAALRSIADEHPGSWVERKPSACALHYRDAPQFAERLTRAVRCASDRWPRLRLLEGQCVLELLPGEANKGQALRQAMQTAPFAGRRPVVAGDDVTDEDAFVAARALGGFGIAVGPRRSPAARYRLADPDALDGWLRGLVFTRSETLDA